MYSDKNLQAEGWKNFGYFVIKGETFTRVNGDGSFSGSKRLQKC